MYGGTRGAARVGFMETPGTEKEAGLVLGFLVRVPAASAAAIHRRAVRIPRRASAASLPPALISQGSGRTGAGRSGREGGGEGDRGARGPRPCSGACQSCVVFFGQALRLSVPLCSPAQGGARSMPP